MKGKRRYDIIEKLFPDNPSSPFIVYIYTNKLTISLSNGRILSREKEVWVFFPDNEYEQS